MTAMLASSENDDLSPSVSTKPGNMLTTFTPVPFNSCLKSTNTEANIDPEYHRSFPMKVQRS